MAVTSTSGVSQGHFHLLHSKVRGGPEGTSPVGTLSLVKRTAGAAGGGTATVIFTQREIEFGFRCILVPTLITTFDNLAAAEVVNLIYLSTSKRMGATDVSQAVLAIAASGGNIARFVPDGVLFEVETKTAQEILQCVWSTNTDGKVYDIRAFFSVFDAELIEKHGSVSDFLAGVR